MVTLSVCLETVFTDSPIEERIARIAASGYRAIEFWHPEATWDGKKIDDALAKDAVVISQSCKEHGVTVASVLTGVPSTHSAIKAGENEYPVGTAAETRVGRRDRAESRRSADPPTA